MERSRINPIAVSNYINAQSDFLEMNVREATSDHVYKVCMEFARKLLEELDEFLHSDFLENILTQCVAVLKVAKERNCADILLAGTTVLKKYMCNTRRNTIHSKTCAKIVSVMLSFLRCGWNFLPRYLEVLHLVLERISMKDLIPEPCDMRILLPLLESESNDVRVEAHAVVTYLLAHHVPPLEVLRQCLSLLLTTISNYVVPWEPLRVACAAVGIQVLRGTREAALEMTRAGYVRKLIDLLEHARHQVELPIYAGGVLLTMRKLASLGSPFVERMLENNIQTCLGFYAFNVKQNLRKNGCMLVAYLVEFLGAERSLQLLGGGLIPRPFSILNNCTQDEKDAARSLMFTFFQSPPWYSWFFHERVLPTLYQINFVDRQTHLAYVSTLSRSIDQISIKEQRLEVREWADAYINHSIDFLADD